MNVSFKKCRCRVRELEEVFLFFFVVGNKFMRDNFF